MIGSFPMGMEPLAIAREFLDDNVFVGEDVNLRGDAQRGADDLARRKIRVTQESLGGGGGILAPGTDADHAVGWFDNIAGAGDEKAAFGVHDDQHCFESAEGTVGAPFAREFRGGAGEVARVVLGLGFETLEKGEGIGGGTGESAKDVSVSDAADFFRIRFEDGVIEGDLAISADGDGVAGADREDGGRFPIRVA